MNAAEKDLTELLIAVYRFPTAPQLKIVARRIHERKRKRDAEARSAEIAARRAAKERA